MNSALVEAIVLFALAAWMIVIGVLSVRRSHDRRVKRAIRAAAPTTIAAASSGGLARLSGTLEALDDRLSAPITGRACAYYLATLEIYRTGGRSGRWVEAAREERGVDFRLRDATGAVRVRMGAARVAVVLDHHTASGTFDDPTEVEAAFLERHRHAATNAFGFNLSYRYREGALEFEEQVGALGVMHGAEGERSLDVGPDGVVLVSDDPSTLAISTPLRRDSSE